MSPMGGLDGSWDERETGVGRRARLRLERREGKEERQVSGVKLIFSCLSTASRNIGARSGLKSKPTLAKLSPKYMAWPKSDSVVGAPDARSSFTTFRNCEILRLSQEVKSSLLP